MRIGYGGKQYPEIRNIIGKIEGQNYVLCRDLFSLLRKIALGSNLAITSKLVSNAEFAFNDLGYNNVDLIHFFNTVSFSSTPWVTTFETVAPRFKGMLDWHKYGRKNIAQDPWVRKAVKAMAAPNCKALIAISNCAAGMQRDALTTFPEYSSAISKKLVVIHPPQRVLLSPSLPRKEPKHKSITIMLVGHYFFQKGGREIVSTARKLREKEGVDLSLIIVSRVQADTNATATNQKDEAAAKETLRNNASWITWHESLPNTKVIELMHSCDIGLLPSYAETYGYSVLEFQACGVPVITTNIRSFPEINNQEAGWVIDIPKHADGESQHQDEEGRANISAAISNGLDKILREALDSPDLIKQKGQAALQRIIEHHSPEKFAQQLMNIYQGR